MLRTESDPRGLFSSGGTSDNDCGGEASGEEADAACACQPGPCPLYPEAHAPSMGTPLLCEHCGKHRLMATRYSEGYGTEEECVVSDPQGESDVDADIEDTDCRLQEPGPLQRVSSRRRKRPRVARQDTTESEDDGGGGGGGRSCRTHRWTLRLSPARAHSRTIPEESVSQVRPLVILRPDADRPAELPRGSGPSSPLPLPLPLPPSLPLALLLLLLLLPLSLVAAIVIVSLLRPRAGA